MHRIIIFSFFPGLGIPVRVTSFSSYKLMYDSDFLSGLNLTSTPHIVLDLVKHKIILFETYGKLSRDYMLAGVYCCLFGDNNG